MYIVKAINNIKFMDQHGRVFKLTGIRNGSGRLYGIMDQDKNTWLSVDGIRPYAMDRKYIMQHVLNTINIDQCDFIPAAADQ